MNVHVIDHVVDEALIQTSQINALDHVQADSYRLMQRWYEEERGGNSFLRGIEASIFRDEECRTDMVCLNGRPMDADPIAKFIGDKVIPIYDRVIGHRIHRSMSAEMFADAREYQMKTMVLLGNIVCMILSAVLPALAILVLYNVDSMLARLVTISVMSLIFSLVMTVVAQKKADIFMSTTAFAAVLVVFVGSSGIGNA